MNGNTLTAIGSGSKTLTADDLLGQVDVLYKALDQLKAKIVNSLPAKYGSDAWWVKSDQQALKEIRAGKGTTVHNKKELNQFFQKLGA